jgi:DNA polymerase I-like protein with 3'-5' exonuclease and polymerase domains
LNVDEVFVVDSHEKAQVLLARLAASGSSCFGVDCETKNCDPRKQSPVGTAEIVCWSIAWKEGERTRAAFIWREWLGVFKAWLEDASVHKVGANFTAYDMHAFENHGILIRGFVHDNKHTSRLWYSSKDVRHDLKSQAADLLGARTSAYSDLFSRPARTKDKAYKTTRYSKPRKGPLVGVPTLTCEGSVSTFSHKKRELVPLETVRPDGLYKHLLPSLYEYAAADAVYSLELAPKREAQLASRPAKFGSTLKLYNDVWNPLLLMLNRMERTGITVDAGACAAIEAHAASDMAGLMPGIVEFAARPDFNPGSPDHLKELLFKRLRLRRPPIKGTMFAISRSDDNEWSTSEASLHWLQLKHPEHHEQLDLIRRWRKVRRNRIFARDLPTFTGMDGRVHTVMGPEADTGRLSCKLPALQQIPSKNDVYGLRGAFVAAPGHRLVVADYSQLEVYVLAHLLIKLFDDHSLRIALETGDVYTWIARECWPEAKQYTSLKSGPGKKLRDYAKIVVLAKNYCKSVMGMALTLLDETGEPADESFCQGLYDTFDAALPGVVRWQDWISAYARKHHGTPTLLGRWRPLPAAGTNRGDRQAANGPVQGSAMDIAVMGMLSLNTYDLVPGWFNAGLAALGARCLLQVHDELIFEVPEDNADAALQLIEYGMTHPPMLDLAVQLKIEAKVGNSWKQAK